MFLQQFGDCVIIRSCAVGGNTHFWSASCALLHWNELLKKHQFIWKCIVTKLETRPLKNSSWAHEKLMFWRCVVFTRGCRCRRCSWDFRDSLRGACWPLCKASVPCSYPETSSFIIIIFLWDRRPKLWSTGIILCLYDSLTNEGPLFKLQYCMLNTWGHSFPLLQNHLTIILNCNYAPNVHQHQ